MERGLEGEPVLEMVPDVVPQRCGVGIGAERGEMLGVRFGQCEVVLGLEEAEAVGEGGVEGGEVGVELGP